MVYDGAVQHPGLAVYFSEVLRGNESLLYSFKGALGYNFYSTAIYYLFSPLNILLLFFNSSNIHYFYALIVPLKIGLCGLTMFIFLGKKNKIDIWSLTLSLCYSLMAYNIIYYSSYMWIDGLIMLPLVMLGIDKLIKGESRVLYVMALVLAIIFNFYIGYMICIFAVIYFFYEFYFSKTRDKKTIIDFFVLSFLAGLICAFVIVPVALDLVNGKGTTFGNAQYFDLDLDSFKVLYKFMLGSYTPADIAYGLPNVYTSLLIVFLNISYYFNRKVDMKKKIVTLAITSFFILGFSFNLIDYAWQMFQPPIWFPARYSFVLSFFLIVVAYDNIRNIDFMYIKNKNFLITFLFAFLSFSMSAFIDGFYDSKLQIILFLMSILLFILYYFFRKKEVAILLILILELTCNSAVTLKKMEFVFSMKERDKYYESAREVVDQIEITESAEKFYRVEFDSTFTNNEGALHGYNGISYFNSLRNSKLIDFLQYYLGISTDKVCRINYSTYNPILNALFGVKYLSGNWSDYYSPLNDEYQYIFKNDDAFTLGFSVSPSIYDSSMVKSFPVYNFNTLIKDVTGESGVGFKAINPVLENYVLDEKDGYKIFKQTTTGYNKIEYRGEADVAGFLYFNNIDYVKRLGGKMFIDGNLIDEADLYTVIYLDKGSSWRIVMEAESTTKMPYEMYKFYTDVYFLSYDSYKYFVDRAKSVPLVITEYEKDDYLVGNISVDEKSVLFTTIPYDKGWSVFVDGKKTEVKKIYDVFIGIDLERGEHQIEFRYVPPGLKISVPISILGVMLCGLYLYLMSHKSVWRV